MRIGLLHHQGRSSASVTAAPGNWKGVRSRQAIAMTLVAVQHGSRFKPEDTSQSMPRRAVRTALPLPDPVVLVLQGGGALGAVQAGVEEARIDRGVGAGWVGGEG